MVVAIPVAKRELAIAKDFVVGKASAAGSEAHKAANIVEAEASKAEKKGWSLWGSAKSSASEAANKLEKDAQSSASVLKTDAEQIAAKAQADFEAAKAHAAAGGEDALRRGREIAEEGALTKPLRFAGWVLTPCCCLGPFLFSEARACRS